MGNGFSLHVGLLSMDRPFADLVALHAFILSLQEVSNTNITASSVPSPLVNVTSIL